MLQVFNQLWDMREESGLLGRDLGHDADRDPGYGFSNMADRSVSKPQIQTTQQRNLLIKGLNGNSDDEIKAVILKATTTMRITIYASKIEQVIRLKRRSSTNIKPGPVVVTMSRAILCDNILCNNGELKGIKDYEQVFFNADESLETRRSKSILRKAAYNVKRLGDIIVFEHNQITINDVTNTMSDTGKIPKKYLEDDRKQDDRKQDDRKQDDRKQDNKQDEDEAIGACAAMETNVDCHPPAGKQPLILEGKRMKLTKKGLCFSGPTAVFSNMAYIPIRYKKKPDDWNRRALLDGKCCQHPEIIDRLIETHPYPLIEARKPIPDWGNNEFGEIATRYRRDHIIRHRAKNE